MVAAGERTAHRHLRALRDAKQHASHAYPARPVLRQFDERGAQDAARRVVHEEAHDTGHLDGRQEVQRDVVARHRSCRHSLRREARNIEHAQSRLRNAVALDKSTACERGWRMSHVAASSLRSVRRARSCARMLKGNSLDGMSGRRLMFVVNVHCAPRHTAVDESKGGCAIETPFRMNDASGGRREESLRSKYRNARVCARQSNR